MSISKRFRTEYVEILNRHSQSLSPGLVNFYNRLTYSLTFSDKKSQPDQHYDYDAGNMLVIWAAQPGPNGQVSCLHSFKIF